MLGAVIEAKVSVFLEGFMRQETAGGRTSPTAPEAAVAFGDRPIPRTVFVDPLEPVAHQRVLARRVTWRTRLAKVVAEGVETAEQRAFLQDCGYDELRGISSARRSRRNIYSP